MLIIDIITAMLLGACAVLFIAGCCTSNPSFLIIITALLIVLLFLNGLESIWDED
jgi:uncharacterized membrane protein YccC